MAKIVLIGAGSHAFSRHLIPDILWYPELRDSTISLMDVNKDSLNLMTAFARKIVEQHRFNTKIEATTNRREALNGADYVIVSIEAGGWQNVLADLKITTQYEAGDGWTGPAILFSSLRQIPVFLDICHDMEELCPNAWLLNYSNPMPLICWALNDHTRIKNVGLCHSVENTANELARYLGISYKDLEVPEGAIFDHFGSRPHEEFKEISHWVAGLNHMAWFLEFKWRGQDAYPLLRERFKDPAVYSGPNAHWAGPDIVRVELFKTFGYYVTEASWIAANLVPYFYKKDRPEILEKLMIPKFAALTNCQENGARRMKEDKELMHQIKSGVKFPIIRSVEYGATIIHSMETGVPARISGNVKNKGLITNLTEGCCVEVPCLVDKEGVHPCHVGDLPPQLAALNQVNISAEELAVQGIVEKDKTKIFYALLLDPLTSAKLTIDETREMLDKLFKVEAEYLKSYK
jgi:alpha-galactosidase